ncbi:MAG: hypothetical protein R2874_03720 [Desulfobacterales bacterium]
MALKMAALFKTSPDKIGMLLKKRGRSLKDIDLATAKKYAGAILSTGALCAIDPPEKQAAVSQTGASARPGSRAVLWWSHHKDRAEPRVVIPLSQKPEDRFTPGQLQRYPVRPAILTSMCRMSAVPLSQITLVSGLPGSMPEET